MDRAKSSDSAQPLCLSRRSFKVPTKNRSSTHLHALQLLQTLLHQLLHFAPIALAYVFPESVPCPPLGVLAEVIGGELIALAQERAKEGAGFEGGHGGLCGCPGGSSG